MIRIGIFVGTVYGNALLVAEEASAILQEQGHDVSIFDDINPDNWRQYHGQVVLIITSTTGQGEFPDNIAWLYDAMRQNPDQQKGLRYSVIALGDSNYDHFCGAGIRFDTLLQTQGAARIGAPLLVDANETPEPESVALPWVETWGRSLA